MYPWIKPRFCNMASGHLQCFLKDLFVSERDRVTSILWFMHPMSTTSRLGQTETCSLILPFSPTIPCTGPSSTSVAENWMSTAVAEMWSAVHGMLAPQGVYWARVSALEKNNLKTLVIRWIPLHCFHESVMGCKKLKLTQYSSITMPYPRALEYWLKEFPFFS